MRVDKTKIGFIRKLKRHTEQRQLDELRRGGLPANALVYVIGKDGAKSWRDCLNQRRSGDTVWIYSLAFLADQKSADNPYPSMDLRDAIEKLDQCGTTLIETCTGRTMADPDQRKAMIIDAARSLGQGRALPSSVAKANGAKGGRKAKVFTDAEIVEAKRVWESRRKTWRDVAAALPKGFSTARAYRMFGPRN